VNEGLNLSGALLRLAAGGDVLLLLGVLLADLPRNFVPEPFGLGEHFVESTEHFAKALGAGERLTLVGHYSDVTPL
jgi:hypothetical protein